MVYLKNELEYLANIRITSEFDIRLCNEIKKFVYKILEINSISEIYDEYKKFRDLTNLTFPRVEDKIESNKDDLEIEDLITIIVFCSIDKILSTRDRVIRCYDW